MLISDDDTISNGNRQDMSASEDMPESCYKARDVQRKVYTLTLNSPVTYTGAAVFVLIEN